MRGPAEVPSRTRPRLNGGMAQHWIADENGLDALRLEYFEPAPPKPDQVTIEVRASGMNPADYKAIAGGYGPPSRTPIHLGYELAGVVTAAGTDSGFVVGDEVLAFRILDGYSTTATVTAKSVFHKPSSLSFPEAANLLLAGATAADMIRVVAPQPGETVLVHGASGAVGVLLLQLLRRAGVRAIGTASDHHFERVSGFGGEPIPYGAGLADRVRAVAPDGIAAAFDTVGTDEAVNVSLELVADRHRIVSIAAFGRAEAEGFQLVGGMSPQSAAFRDSVRQNLVDLAASGDLVVPIARTFPLGDAVEALTLLGSGHPGGKLALIP